LTVDLVINKLFDLF